MSSALAGRFLNTGAPGKSLLLFFSRYFYYFVLRIFLIKIRNIGKPKNHLAKIAIFDYMKVENERIQDITKSQNKHKRLGKSKYFTIHEIECSFVHFYRN